jgi:MOSC domain-containing protein YiiM
MAEASEQAHSRRETSAGAVSRAEHGTVVGLHRKPEVSNERGLPKPSVREVRVLRSGFEGDFNRYRHEDKADDERMAILLVPKETLEELNREGWPIRPGDLGENITSAGVPYGAFAPGRRFRVGEVELEVSKPCDPCDNLYLLPYVGAERGPEFMKTMMNRRGWYARVLREGTVRVGDSIELPL